MTINMKRVLLINKFYYPRGGDCTAVLSQESLLRSKGHEVALFSMQYPQNLPSTWESFFPSEVNFAKSGIQAKFIAAERIFFSREVKSKFNRLIDTFKPDVIHAHNIHSYISPYVLKLAHEKGIKTVWTLHDRKLVCPSYSCLRDNIPCEACFTNKLNVVKYKCMKGSLPASIIAWIEAVVWNKNILESFTDRFISPSLFLKGQMIRGGFNGNKIEVLPNFIPDNLPSIECNKEDYYCYVGRLSAEKGVESLLKAAIDIPTKLIIIGDGELMPYFKEKYQASHIHFLGYQPKEKVLEVVGKARFSVLPSICYENNPYSIIESHCMGTPVLGANIGGIPELITENSNGLLYEAGNIRELRYKIIQCLDTFKESDSAEIAEIARNRYSADLYYLKINQIYGEQTNN